MPPEAPSVDRLACPLVYLPFFTPGHTPQLIDKYSGKHGEEPGFYNVCIACSCGVKVEAPSWAEITVDSWQQLITKCRVAAKLLPVAKFPKLEVVNAVEAK